MLKSARKKLRHFFWRTRQSKASLNETMFLSWACRKHSCDRNRTISMYWCKSPSIDHERHYFVLSAELFILQYFWLYFTIFCSAMKKKLFEWKSNSLNIFGDRSNLHRSFDADDVFIVMSNIGSICHYFVYETAFKYSFEMKLHREMKSCGDIVRYEHSDRIEKQFCIRHYQMVIYPSTNPIWRSLTSRRRLLYHRSIQRFTDLSV